MLATECLSSARKGGTRFHREAEASHRLACLRMWLFLPPAGVTCGASAKNGPWDPAALLSPICAWGPAWPSFCMSQALQRPGLRGSGSWKRPWSPLGFPPGAAFPRPGRVTGLRHLRSPERSCVWVTAVLVPRVRASPHLILDSELLTPIHEAALPFIWPRWDRGSAVAPEREEVALWLPQARAGPCGWCLEHARPPDRRTV